MNKGRVAMNRLKLVLPTVKYKDEIMNYKREFIENGDSMHGTAGLSNAENFEEWYSALCDNMREETVRGGLVPATTFLAISNNDGRLIGMIQIRHRLNDYLLNFGGHIGYSVRKSERQKGYATEMLALALKECMKLNIKRVLITCDKDNIASAKTIINNGGILENEVPDENGMVQRYWISLEKKWIALLGSPRRHKNTETLMDYYIEELKKNGRKVEKVVLSEIELNICDGCGNCAKNNTCHYEDDISRVINMMKNIEGVILGSPSYNYNVTPYMKIFLDRLFSLFTFGKGSWSSELDSRGIKAIIIGLCAGEDEYSMGFTIESMKRVMIDHGIEVVIEESYFGTRRKPVIQNEEIRIEIARKVEDMFSLYLEPEEFNC